MRTASLIIAAATILAILAAGADADTHESDKNCTAPGYENPAELMSENKLCTTSAVGDAEAKATAAAASVTGDFSATDIGAEARGGEALMNKLLAVPGGGDMPTDELVAYAQALVVLVAPPAAFLILNFCCCFWCSCMRGCCWLCPSCCRCCKCLPSDEHPYSKCQKCIPALVWLILSLCVFIFAIMGVISGTYKLVDSTSVSVCTWDNAFIRFKAFMNNVEAPLGQLSTKFTEAVDDMQDATVFPDSLTEGVEDLAESLGVIKDYAKESKTDAEKNLNSTSTDLMNTSCIENWQEILDQSKIAEEETQNSAKDLNNVLKDIQNLIKKNIVDQSTPVANTIKDAKGSISDMKKQLDSTMDPGPGGLNMFSFAELSRDNRDNSAFSQWGWVFLVVVFAIVGILGMLKCKEERNYEPDGNHPRSNPNLSGDAMKLNTIGGCCARFGTLSWCIYLVFATIGALFALIFLPLTAVVSDMCLVLPTLPKQLGEITSVPSIQSISDTCWNSTGNLFDGFGLNDVINTDDIDFGDLSSSIANPEISDEGLVKLKELLDDMQQDLTYCFDAANKNNAVDNMYIAIEHSRSNVTQAEDNFKNDKTADKLEKSGKKIIKAVDEAICQFKNAATCYFIKTTWDEVSDLVCKEFNAGLSNMALYELLIAALAIPYTLALLCLNRKIGGHGPVKTDESAYSVDAKEIQAIELADGAYYN